jgi:HEPN domain-containing protein
MSIVQFLDRGWEVYDEGVRVTDMLWEAVFEEESPFEVYSKSQCEMLVKFVQDNDIDYARVA